MRVRCSGAKLTPAPKGPTCTPTLWAKEGFGIANATSAATRCGDDFHSHSGSSLLSLPSVNADSNGLFLHGRRWVRGRKALPERGELKAWPSGSASARRVRKPAPALLGQTIVVTFVSNRTAESQNIDRSAKRHRLVGRRLVSRHRSTIDFGQSASRLVSPPRPPRTIWLKCGDGAWPLTSSTS